MISFSAVRVETMWHANNYFSMVNVRSGDRELTWAEEKVAHNPKATPQYYFIFQTTRHCARTGTCTSIQNSNLCFKEKRIRAHCTSFSHRKTATTLCIRNCANCKIRGIWNQPIDWGIAKSTMHELCTRTLAHDVYIHGQAYSHVYNSTYWRFAFTGEKCTHW